MSSDLLESYTGEGPGVEESPFKTEGAVVSVREVLLEGVSSVGLEPDVTSRLLSGTDRELAEKEREKHPK